MRQVFRLWTFALRFRTTQSRKFGDFDEFGERKSWGSETRLTPPRANDGAEKRPFRGGRRGTVHSKQPPRPGDWLCHKCNFVNFRTQRVCLRCVEPISDESMRWANEDGTPSIETRRPGDWTCPSTWCSTINFSDRTKCYRCDTDITEAVERTPHPDGSPWLPAGYRPGNWRCDACSSFNDLQLTKCRSCHREAVTATDGPSDHGDKRIWIEQSNVKHLSATEQRKMTVVASWGMNPPKTRWRCKSCKTINLLAEDLKCTQCGVECPSKTKK